jgi:hypothetical protein
MRGRKVFALLMAMRTGKTKVVVDDWGELLTEEKVDDLLVVAPGGAYLTWIAAIKADLPEDIYRAGRVYPWVSKRAKTVADKNIRQVFMEHKGPRILLINSEALSAVEEARNFVTEFLNQRRCMFVFDESVIMKEVDSIIGKFCVKVALHASHRRILTGLATPRSPLDLFNQFWFLDPRILGFVNFVAYRERYAEVEKVCMLPNQVLKGKLKGMAGVLRYRPPALLKRTAATLDPTLNVNAMSPLALKQWIETWVEGVDRQGTIEAITRLGGYVQTIPIVKTYKNEAELHDKIAPHSFRVRLEDCYDMPASDYSFWDVSMSPDQQRIYKELKAEAVALISGQDFVTATHVITQMLRLHQVLCGYTVDDDGKKHFIPERRTAELVKLLRNYEGKAIVWCSYDYSVQKVSMALTDEFGEGSVARFWGGNVGVRESEEVRFRTESGCRFMVSTPDAGGRGRDWSVADLCVYYSSRNNLDHRQQSEERCKAVGKMKAVAYIDMITRDTVEEKIIEALRKKIDMAALINGDTWREWLV